MSTIDLNMLFFFSRSSRIHRPAKYYVADHSQLQYHHAKSSPADRVAAAAGVAPRQSHTLQALTVHTRTVCGRAREKKNLLEKDKSIIKETPIPSLSRHNFSPAADRTCQLSRLGRTWYYLTTKIQPSNKSSI